MEPSELRPLQELSSFVDRDELSRIDFPYLKAVPDSWRHLGYTRDSRGQ